MNYQQRKICVADFRDLTSISQLSSIHEGLSFTVCLCFCFDSVRRANPRRRYKLVTSDQPIAAAKTVCFTSGLYKRRHRYYAVLVAILLRSGDIKATRNSKMTDKLFQTYIRRRKAQIRIYRFPIVQARVICFGK